MLLLLLYFITFQHMIKAETMNQLVITLKCQTFPCCRFSTVFFLCIMILYIKYCWVLRKYTSQSLIMLSLCFTVWLRELKKSCFMLGPAGLHWWFITDNWRGQTAHNSTSVGSKGCSESDTDEQQDTNRPFITALGVSLIISKTFTMSLSWGCQRALIVWRQT